MNTTFAVEPSDCFGLNTLNDALASVSADTINDTLAGTTDMYDMLCGRDTAWLDELHQLLPDLPPSEARLMSLVLIANKARLMNERALDLLVEQVKADPSLQDLINTLHSQDGELQ